MEQYPLDRVSCNGTAIRETREDNVNVALFALTGCSIQWVMAWCRQNARSTWVYRWNCRNCWETSITNGNGTEGSSIWSYVGNHNTTTANRNWPLLLYVFYCHNVMITLSAPVVTLSGPNTSSSATRPPIDTSICASSCDLVILYCSLSGTNEVCTAFNTLHTMAKFKTKHVFT